MGALQRKEVPRLDDAVCTAEVVRKCASRCVRPRGAVAAGRCVCVEPVQRWCEISGTRDGAVRVMETGFQTNGIGSVERILRQA